MLTVDSNSRIKLSEIRATPWFQHDLPAYISVPARRRHHHDDDDEGGDDSEPSSPVPDVAPPEGTEFVDGFGWLERAIVEDLAKRIPDTTVDQLLNDIRTGEDRSLRIAYQLCRDNRKPEQSSASSSLLPGAWLTL